MDEVGQDRIAHGKSIRGLGVVGRYVMEAHEGRNVLQQGLLGAFGITSTKNYTYNKDPAEARPINRRISKRRRWIFFPFFLL